MKRIYVLILVTLLAAASFVFLVHSVLRIADVSEPATTPVEGVTLRRLWATGSVVLALVGMLLGFFARARPDRRSLPIGAVTVGAIAALNGGWGLALATGGPGSGNGVVGAAAALVLGLTAIGLGGRALVRSKSQADPLATNTK